MKDWSPGDSRGNHTVLINLLLLCRELLLVDLQVFHIKMLVKAFSNDDRMSAQSSEAMVQSMFSHV